MTTQYRDSTTIIEYNFLLLVLLAIWQCLELSISCLKRKCHDMDIFWTVQKFKSTIYLYTMMILRPPLTAFHRVIPIKLFIWSYEITYFENAYWSPPYNFLYCDCMLFSLAEDKMCQNLLVMAAFGMVLQVKKWITVPVNIFRGQTSNIGSPKKVS